MAGPFSEAAVLPIGFGMGRPQNLYRIDDLLLKAAAVCVVLGFVGGSALLAALQPENGRNLAWALAPLALAPVGLLALGLLMRRRERRVAAIWDLLRQEPALRVQPLLENSDFERADLEHAVRFLNNRGLDHYVWDRGTDTIQDARLRTKHLHVEECDACGVKIALDVPLLYAKLPTCTHCGDPLSPEALGERRRDAIDALRAEHRFEDASASGVRHFSQDFSPLVFFFLLCLFWPAAFFYAWSKWEGH